MKNNRHQVLLELIKEKVVLTQEQLQKELLSRGFNVTQATVSRDIKSLGIIKALDEQGNYRYTSNSIKADGSDRYTEILKKSAHSVKAAMNDVIIKCYSGTASAACTAIDTLFSDMFLGTLAGDDTILVVTESADVAKIFAEKIKDLINL